MALLEEWHKIAYNDKADQGELQRFWQHDPDGTVFGYGFGKSVCYYMGVLSRLVHRRVRYLFNPKLETLFFAKVREKGGNP